MEAKGHAVDTDAADTDAVRARLGLDDLDDEQLQALAYAIPDRHFENPRHAVEALRWALEHRQDTGDTDADTTTYLLILMLEKAPDDDALLLEYIREVADSGYAYTDRRLSDLAVTQGIAAARAKRLALASTFVEIWCLEVSRTTPPQPWVAQALRVSFALAIRLGATEDEWLAMRGEYMAFPGGDRTKEDEFRRWTAPA